MGINGLVRETANIAQALVHSCARFVMEITKLQTRPDNMPVLDSSLDGQAGPLSQEEKKDQ
jgi:hypothetical protein